MSTPSSPPFQVMEDMADIFSKVDKGGEGVCVQVTRGGAERGGARRIWIWMIWIWIWICTLYPINPRHPPPHLSTPQASTLGALEALLEFLSTKEVNIAVAGINIGPVHKKDVMRANVMNERSEEGGRGGGGGRREHWVGAQECIQCRVGIETPDPSSRPPVHPFTS